MRKITLTFNTAVYIAVLVEGGVDWRWGDQGGSDAGRTPSCPPLDPHPLLAADAQPPPLPLPPFAPALASPARLAPWSPESPSSTSFADSGTKSWFVVLSGRARVPSRFASAWWDNGSCGIPSPAPEFGSACRSVGRVCAFRSPLRTTNKGYDKLFLFFPHAVFIRKNYKQNNDWDDDILQKYVNSLLL